MRWRPFGHFCGFSLIWVFITGARAALDDPAIPQDSPHPCLLFGPEHIPRLKAKLGYGRVGSDPGGHANAAGRALTALLKGQRDDASIQRLQDLNTESAYEGMLIYDFQYPFMTEAERSHAREWFLDHAENLRKDAERESIWYFTKNTSNWVITYMSDYATQRILWPGIIFSDDPRAPALRKQGVTLMKYFMEKGPGMLEESLTLLKQGYGVWDLSLGGLLFISAHRHRDLLNFDPLEFNGRVLYGDGIFRTYVYLTIDSLKGKGKVYNTEYGPHKPDGGIYGVPLGGHGEWGSGPHMPFALELLAGLYRDPVFSWLYLQSRRTNSWPTDNDFHNIRDLLYRGIAEPRSPRDAGWPLHKFFPKAGVGVMRKSWADATSVVVAHSGWGGSHGQPCQGQVVFVGQGWPVLAKVCNNHPTNEGYGDQEGTPEYLYTHSFLSNNTLIVDGQGQESTYPLLPRAQRKLGDMRQLGPYAYEMDPSIAYEHIGGVKWKRTVRYDPEKDLLIIEDAVDAGGKERNLTFNWVTEGKVVDDTTYDMPGPYWMAAKVLSGGRMTSRNVTHHAWWTTIQASVRGQRAKVRWAVGPRRSLVKQAVEQDHSKMGLASYPR